jgi:hypothetical protein
LLIQPEPRDVPDEALLRKSHEGFIWCIQSGSWDA